MATKEFEKMEAADMVKLSSAELDAMDDGSSLTPAPAAPAAQPAPAAPAAPAAAPTAAPTAKPDEPAAPAAERSLEEELAAAIAANPSLAAKVNAPAAPAAPAAAPTVPLGAVQDERTKRQAAEEQTSALQAELAEMRAQIAALQQPAAPAAPSPTSHAAARATAQTRANELRTMAGTITTETDAAIDDTAGRYDRGEITATEFEREKRRIYTEARAKLAPINNEQAQVSRVLNGPDMDAVLARNIENPSLVEATQNLGAANPWVEQVSDVAYDAMQARALKLMEERGQALDASVGSLFLLRQTIVEAGKEMGFDRVSAQPQSTGTAPAAPAGGAAQPAVTTEQRQAKVELSTAQPPALGQAGATGGNDMVTRLENLTPLELSKLPESTLARLG